MRKRATGSGGSARMVIATPAFSGEVVEQERHRVVDLGGLIDVVVVEGASTNGPSNP